MRYLHSYLSYLDFAKCQRRIIMKNNKGAGKGKVIAIVAVIVLVVGLIIFFVIPMRTETHDFILLSTIFDLANNAII